MKKKIKLLAIVSVLVVALGATAVSAKNGTAPETIPLPNGFQPEGIVSGYGSDFYVGSIPTGAIYKGDFTTGSGELFAPGGDGLQAIGLAFDERTGYLFVSGGPTGAATIYDTVTNAFTQTHQLTDAASTFVNDAIVTDSGVFFTDSFNQVLYRVPLNGDGSLPDPLTSETIPLSGDWEFVDGFNANGIEAFPDGRLIVVNSSLGTLYIVDPVSGEASLVDLGGGSVPSGDGLLLDGNRLYVVQNFLNQIAVIKFFPGAKAARIGGTITSPHFMIPTTVTEYGNSLYAVNARFDISPTPDTEYDVVRTQKGPN